MDQQQLRTRRRWLAPLIPGFVILLCIGMAGAAGTLLAWPFRFGLPLFAQVFCYMFLCYRLARRTRPNPEHPSFANVPAAAVIAQMEQTRSRLLAAELAGGGSAIVLGLAAMIAASPNTPGEWPLMLAASNVLFALGVALLFHGATLFPQRAAYEYVRQIGAPATARVLKVTRMSFSQPGRTYEMTPVYHLELEVQPPTGAPYRVAIQQLIR